MSHSNHAWYSLVVSPKDPSINDFGLLIAYLLPGFAALWGCGYFVPEIRVFMSVAPDDSPTLGGFLYVTLAAIAAGLTVSTIRWLLLDGLHHFTGLSRPAYDFSQFREHVAAYSLLNDIHYRYYQFYGNSVIALAWVEIARRSVRGWLAPPDMVEAAILVLIVVFFLGSRDTLCKFYTRTEQFLRQSRAGRKGAR